MPEPSLDPVGSEGVSSTRFEVEMAAHEGAIDHAQDLVEKAHQVCPYSNATRNNVEVTLKTEVV